MKRAISGILAAAFVLGVGELLAALIGPDSSPYVAVGSAVVDNTPEAVREWAIGTFGTSDKTALFVGMSVIIVGLAALAGVVERRRAPYGSALFVVLGLIGIVSATTRSGATLTSAVPTLVGVAAGIAVLRALVTRAETVDGSGRRSFLTFGAVIAGSAVLAGVAGRMLSASTRSVTQDRATFAVPTPTSPAPPVPSGADLKLSGLSTYVTDNADFYRIDTALVVPKVSTQEWSLRIHGMVDREMTLTFADLQSRMSMERMVTLTCVSNPIGGDLVGNAVWTGYSLKDLLEEAGPQAKADMVLSSSRDAFTAGTPLEVLLDGRDAMLAVAMNGQPLPVEHGYPARLIVPGLYGYVSATKWVTDLEVTRFSKATAYWTDRGWSEKGPIKTATRIDTPREGRSAAAGDVVVAGVAWAQHRGISRVEVRFDGGPWTDAALSEEYSRDTWRQWTVPWSAASGSHLIEARATDSTGEVQTEDLADTVPDGATGYAQVRVAVA
ncbi:putative oxidoreductase [Rhodococcoides trifolii]|uniref:Oxidoreductase n=1 Tax=Rhodococcoides trifolii TaxID=908250 RepID=A0A917FQK0_9NOCA|nr:molybdopterin-dependent oxidoreductase [Rhodococcus trifolii]GGF97763.1 putative oxidoreductase [Rhodococcus trifolii]